MSRDFNDFTNEELERLPKAILEEFRHELCLKNDGNLKWIETYRKMIRKNLNKIDLIEKILEERRDEDA